MCLPYLLNFHQTFSFPRNAWSKRDWRLVWCFGTIALVLLGRSQRTSSSNKEDYLFYSILQLTSHFKFLLPIEALFSPYS